MAVTTSGLAKAELTVALCGEPDATTMLAAVPAVVVRLSDAGVPTPLVVAVTLYPPVIVLAVKPSDSWPLPLVEAVIVVALLLKRPLALLVGAAKVTLTPG